MDKDGGGLVVVGRAKIDKRTPFWSVKEVVTLFGERILARETYAIELKEIQATAGENGHTRPRINALETELEETKLSLQKAKEEGNVMTYCIKSMREELEQTKREMQRLKGRRVHEKWALLEPEIEHLKFIENATKLEVNEHNIDDKVEEFRKKRYVKFASPLLLDKVIAGREEMPERPCKKKKSLIPILGWLFSKRKGS